jgi:S1-C subfamily serine protease
MIASHAPVVMPAPNASTLDSRVIQGIKASSFLLFQLDATTFPGHSGSPLYDAASGDVVGIVNMGFVKGTKDTAIGQPSGISFAVPIQHLQELIRSVR